MAIPLEVVFEDDDVLVVDKPPGLVVHPAPATGGDAGQRPARPRHRLRRDRGRRAARASSTAWTATRRGLLMVASNDAAQASLMAQLKARRVKKTYLALVQGACGGGRPDRGAHRPRPEDRMRMAVVPDGRPSVTGYRVRERFAGWTLLELDLVTGPDPPDPRPPGGPRPPGRRRPGLRDGDVAPRARRPRAPVPPRLAPGARLAVLERRPRPRGGAAAAGAGGGPRRPARAADVDGRAVEPRERAPLTDAGDPLAGAPRGACSSSSRARPGSGKDTIIEALRARPRIPTTTTS